MAIKSFNPDKSRALLRQKEVIDHIPEDRLFKFNYKRLGGIAMAQLGSYLRRIKFQKSMRRVYLFEINKLILTHAISSIFKVINFKFKIKDGKNYE